MMPIKRLSLTDLKSSMPRGAREKTLKAALTKDGVMDQWGKTAWGKNRQAQKARSQMNNFDRFKLMVAKKKRSLAVKTALKKNRKK